MNEEDYYKQLDELEQRTKRLLQRVNVYQDGKLQDNPDLSLKEVDDIEEMLQQMGTSSQWPLWKKLIDNVRPGWMTWTIVAGGLVVTFELIAWLYKISQLLISWFK